MTVAFASGGSGFNIGGVSLAGDAALIEAGFRLAFGRTANIGLSYLGQIADRVSDHSISGTLSWRF